MVCVGHGTMQPGFANRPENIAALFPSTGVAEIPARDKKSTSKVPAVAARRLGADRFAYARGSEANPGLRSANYPSNQFDRSGTER